MMANVLILREIPSDKFLFSILGKQEAEVGVHHPNADKVLARRKYKDGNFFVHFVSLEQSKDETIFVQLPFALTEEEKLIVSQTKTNNPLATIRMRVQENNAFVTTTDLFKMWELFQPLLKEFRALIFNLEFEEQAEVQKRSYIKELQLQCEDDDRLDLRLLIALDNPVSEILQNYYPLINIYCILLWFICTRIGHTYNVVQIVSMQEYCRWFEIYMHTIEMLDVISRQVNVEPWKNFQKKLEPTKYSLIECKHNVVDCMVEQFVQILKSSSSRSLMSFGKYIPEQWGSIKWKEIDRGVVKLLATDDVDNIFVFIPNADNEAKKANAVLNAFLRDIATHDVVNKSVYVCSEHAMHLTAMINYFYPISMSNIAKYILQTDCEKLSFPAKYGIYYPKSFSKEDLYLFAEDMGSRLLSKSPERTKEELQLFCNNEIPFSYQLFKSNYFIHTKLMEDVHTRLHSFMKSGKYEKITIAHFPCMGGTTTARFLVYSFQSIIPILLLKHNFVLDEKFCRIVDEIQSHCSGLVIIADNLKDIRSLETFFSGKRVLLIIFQRVEHNCDADYILQHLNKEELTQFEELYEIVCEEIVDVGFLHLGLAYLHEDYRRTCITKLSSLLQDIPERAMKVLLPLALLKSFGNKESKLPMKVLERISLNCGLQLDIYFEAKLLLLHFLREGSRGVELIHKVVADTVINSCSANIICSTALSMIESVLDSNYTEQQLVIDLICHEKSSNSKFSKLIDFLQLNSELVFEKSLELQNIYCHIHFCRWLMHYKLHGSIEKAKSVIEKASHVKLANDNLLWSTAICCHGDTLRRIYHFTKQEQDASNSIQYYKMALLKNKFNSHASFGLAKVILKFIEFCSFSSDTIQRIQSQLDLDPLLFLVNLYISAKTMKRDNVRNVETFVHAMEELLEIQECAEHKEFLLCNKALDKVTSNDFEYILKWNHLIHLCNGTISCSLRILNTHDKALSVYIEAIFVIIKFLNGEAKTESVAYEINRMKHDFTYPFAYFFKNGDRFQVSKPVLYNDTQNIEIPYFPIQKEFERAPFFPKGQPNSKLMKLYFHNNDGLICSTF